MLCPDCNTYAAEDDIVCPRCGKLLDRQATEEEELMSFRQGRHLRKVQDELPPPPVMPGSTGASRSFEDIRPRETAEATGAVYSRRENLAKTGRFYGLEDGLIDNAPMSYGVSETPTVMAVNSMRFIHSVMILPFVKFDSELPCHISPEERKIVFSFSAFAFFK